MSLKLFLFTCYISILCSCTSNIEESNKINNEQNGLIFIQDFSVFTDGGTTFYTIVKIDTEKHHKTSVIKFKITSKLPQKDVETRKLYLIEYNSEFDLNRKANIEELKEIRSIVIKLKNNLKDIKIINTYLDYLKFNNLSFDKNGRRKLFEIDEKYRPISLENTELCVNFLIDFLNQELSNNN